MAFSYVGITRDPVAFTHVTLTSYNICISMHMFASSTVVLFCSYST